MEKEVEVFKLLGELSRLRIVVLLIDREMCMSHIQQVIQTSQPNVSKQLNALRQLGIVEARKDKQWSYYSISQTFIEEFSLIYQYLNELKEKGIYLADSQLLSTIKTCGCQGSCQCRL